MTRAQACAVIVRMLNLIGGGVDTPTPVPPQESEQESEQEPAETPDQTPAQESEQTETSGKTLANGKPVTVENVQELLEELKVKYPDDAPYNTNFTDGGYGGDLGDLVKQWKVKNTNTMVSLKSGCGGFASAITDEIFGRTGFPCRLVKPGEPIRPGDIVITFTDKTNRTNIGHLAIVYKVWTKDGITYYSGCDNSNSSGSIGVEWRGPKADGAGSVTTAALASGNYFDLAYTRYPD